MSYPRKLQILVIEDEQTPIEAYRLIFTHLQSDFPHTELVFAQSYAVAVELLRSHRIFHVAIVDLNLPYVNREPAAEGLAPGESLLELLARRNEYPVPVVLVISGRLNTANLPDLRNRLGRDFWYGEFVNKGISENEQIRKALEQAHRYCDIGIHVRSSTRGWFPTISPREEYLLKRCVLATPHCLGVDLEWWSAEEGLTLRHPAESELTNVLMGRFLFDGGLGGSIPTFFKFEPVTNASYVALDAAILAHKLPHVKVCYSGSCYTRSLLVTQSVTNRDDPVPLIEFLRHSTAVDSQSISAVMGEIVSQLNQLGDRTEIQVPVRDLLWRYLDRKRMMESWERGSSNISVGQLKTPIDVYDLLIANSSLVWAYRRACIHGDLNATNIAIGHGGQSPPRAFIFDGAGVSTDFDGRDLAALEVSTLLFYSFGEDEGLIESCRSLYDRKILTDTADVVEASAMAINTIRLIGYIRKHVVQDGIGNQYALMVFNAVLMQLFGLTVQSKRNKVTSFGHAARLAVLTATWVQTVAPEYFASENQSV